MTPDPKPKLPPLKERVPLLLVKLAELYPVTRTALDYANPFQLVVATILSAQCTDKRVNTVTPGLFARFPTPQAFAEAKLLDIREAIKSTGFFRRKARLIRGFCEAIVKHHGGEVPGTLAELVKLPGLGRKSANVVLGEGFGVPGITVDTHVGRLARRLGLSRKKNPVPVERDLMRHVPKDQWTAFSHELILHGRGVCKARKPRCESCTLADLCPRRGVKTRGKGSGARGKSYKKQ